MARFDLACAEKVAVDSGSRPGSRCLYEVAVNAANGTEPGAGIGSKLCLDLRYFFLRVCK